MTQSNDYIDKGAVFDWGRASRDYAKYRDIYPEEFYQKILDLGLCQSGQTALDLGTSTGVLPRNLYRYGAKFTGVDIEKRQIDEAKALSALQKMDINYIVAAAEDVNLPDNSFDVVTACQCFIYFDQQRIFPKVHSLLKDGGHFCILWAAWLPFEDDIARKSEEIVLKYNPNWTGSGSERYIPTIPNAALPYFEQQHALLYDIQIPFTSESWHGRIMACRGIGASSLPHDVIRRFEEEHRAYLETASASFKILHYVTALNLRKKTTNNQPVL